MTAASAVLERPRLTIIIGGCLRTDEAEEQTTCEHMLHQLPAGTAALHLRSAMVRFDSGDISSAPALRCAGTFQALRASDRCAADQIFK